MKVYSLLGRAGLETGLPELLDKRDEDGDEDTSDEGVGRGKLQSG